MYHSRAPDPCRFKGPGPQYRDGGPGFPVLITTPLKFAMERSLLEVIFCFKIKTMLGCTIRQQRLDQHGRVGQRWGWKYSGVQRDGWQHNNYKWQGSYNYQHF